MFIASLFIITSSFFQVCGFCSRFWNTIIKSHTFMFCIAILYANVLWPLYCMRQFATSPHKLTCRILVIIYMTQMEPQWLAEVTYDLVSDRHRTSTTTTQKSLYNFPRKWNNSLCQIAGQKGLQGCHDTLLIHHFFHQSIQMHQQNIQGRKYVIMI